jgi:hypothetical protein
MLRRARRPLVAASGPRHASLTSFRHVPAPGDRLHLAHLPGPTCVTFCDQFCACRLTIQSRRSGCLRAERHCRCGRARRLILWRRARSRRDGYDLLACTGLPRVRRDHPETGLTHTRKAVASYAEPARPGRAGAGLAADGSVTLPAGAGLGTRASTRCQSWMFCTRRMAYRTRSRTALNRRSRVLLGEGAAPVEACGVPEVCMACELQRWAGASVRHDDRPCPCACSISFSSGSAAGWSYSAVHRPPRTLSCSFCGTRSPCCAGPIPGPGWTGPTEQSSPR